jgi:hypothetical protein
MLNKSKKAVLLYEPLIVFANEKITEKNWKKVLLALRRDPLPLIESATFSIRPSDTTSWEYEGKRIVGPEPARVVQEEFRADLSRLTDPKRDFRGTLTNSWEYHTSIGTEQEEVARKKLIKDLRKDLTWLLDKINSLTLKSERQTTHADGKTPILVERRDAMEVPMVLVPRRSRIDDFRVLPTDQVFLIPLINDLRSWVYFRLASLWADGLLPRIGLCQNQGCSQFFLAKTDRTDRRYCSQRCAQRVTAAERTKASRVRRATWDSTQEDLEAALRGQNLRSLEKVITKAQQAFTAAYPRQQGPGYNEGQQFLARAERQVRQLRRKKQ